MPRVSATLTVERPEELLASYFPNGKRGGLTIPGSPPGALGHKVRLLVKVQAPAREFELVGLIAWRRKGSKTLAASWGMELLPEDDAVRERLLAFANKQVDSQALRVEPRRPVELTVKLVHGGGERKELLADLSTGGAFIRTRHPLSQGEPVELVVRPPLSFSSVTLAGRVAWARGGGPAAGMGVMFVDPSGAQKETLRKLLSKLAPKA
jgi:uncharacterized protein (TIGR02266 family)